MNVVWCSEFVFTIQKARYVAAIRRDQRWHQETEMRQNLVEGHWGTHLAINLIILHM